MRIPTEHFRNVPVVLLSPSLMNSPVTSTAPSPSHHAHNLTSNSGPSSILDESFPKSLMERLLRSDSTAKVYLKYYFLSFFIRQDLYYIFFIKCPNRQEKQLAVFHHHQRLIIIQLPVHHYTLACIILQTSIIK